MAKLKNKFVIKKKQKALGCLTIVLFIVILSVAGVFKETGETGKIVKNSAWDGSVLQVKSWLKRNLKDPYSVKYIEWSKVVKLSSGNFIVRVKYRAKNSYGAYVIDNKVFYLDKDGVVYLTKDYKYKR